MDDVNMVETTDVNMVETTDERIMTLENLLYYMELLQTKNSSDINSAIQIEAIMTQVVTLLKNTDEVTTTDNLMLEAKVIDKSADLLLNETSKVDCTLNSFDYKQFATDINENICNKEAEVGSDDYFLPLTEIALSILTPPPQFYSLTELFDSNSEKENTPVRPKSRKKRNNITEGQQEEKKAPEKISQAEKEEDSVEESVKFLWWALKTYYRENPDDQLNYFVFVTDPNSFEKTVENIYNLLFLLKDGKLKTVQDKKKLYIKLCTKEEMKLIKSGQTEFKQRIYNICMADWERIKQRFNIKKSFLEKYRNVFDQQ